MNQIKMTTNRMPVHTWNRLNINTAKLTLCAPETLGFTPDEGLPAPGQVSVVSGFPQGLLDELGPDFFIPAEMGEFIDINANRRQLIQIPQDYKSPEPIVVWQRLSRREPGLMDDLVIEAGERSEVTVIIRYSSESGSRAEHCGRTRLIVRPGARLRLIKTQMLAGDAVSMDAVEGVVLEHARADVILAELGGLNSTESCNLQLAGLSSEANLDVIYLGEGERSLDMSYRMEHRGKKTVSGIRAKGILHGRSRKVLRDTLDFISGSSGAKAREEESVLLLSSEVRNVSVPLLLCGEDDVEGEHAANSGQLDEKVLFYLMSRGIEELEARKLLAQAALSAIVEKIPDASLQEQILETVSRAVAREG